MFTMSFVSQPPPHHNNSSHPQPHSLNFFFFTVATHPPATKKKVCSSHSSNLIQPQVSLPVTSAATFFLPDLEFSFISSLFFSTPSPSSSVHLKQQSPTVF